MIIYDVRAKDLSNGYEFDTLVAEDESADPDLPEWEDREDYLYNNFGLHDDDIHHYFNAGEVGNNDEVETDEFKYKIIGMRWKGVD